MTTETTIQDKDLLLQSNLEGKCDRFDPEVDTEEETEVGDEE